MKQDHMTLIEEAHLLQSGHKTYFGNKDMNCHMQWFLGYATLGGAEYGECMRVANRIEDGDPQSWVSAWQHMARHVEA